MGLDNLPPIKKWKCLAVSMGNSQYDVIGMHKRASMRADEYKRRKSYLSGEQVEFSFSRKELNEYQISR